MDEYLRQHAGDDWIKIHIAYFFDQLVREVRAITERNPNSFIATITIWDLLNILSQYPGRERGRTYKLWGDPWGRKLTHTPPDISDDQLIGFSEELLRALNQTEITIDPACPVWEIPKKYRYIIITAVAISVLKKVPLGTIPSRVKFQIKKPEEGVVLAILTGIFYRRPHPEEPPFVEVGDIVEEGRPICILEAMKIFNTILAEHKMRILEVVAQDGGLVSEGDILFRIEILEG